MNLLFSLKNKWNFKLQYIGKLKDIMFQLKKYINIILYYILYYKIYIIKYINIYLIQIKISVEKYQLKFIFQIVIEIYIKRQDRNRMTWRNDVTKNQWFLLLSLFLFNINLNCL